MKKILGIFLLLFAFVGLVSCQSNDSLNKLETPSNIVVNQNVATWNNVENAKNYRLKIVNEANEEFIRIAETATADLTSYGLAYGKYSLFIQAVANKNSEHVDSDYSSEVVKFELKNIIKEVKELTGDALINGDYVKWLGRTSYDEENNMNIVYHSGSSFEVKFIGSKVTVKFNVLKDKYGKTKEEKFRPYITAIVDGDYENRLWMCLDEDEMTIDVANLSSNDKNVHILTVYKSTESTDSHYGVSSITTDGTFIEGVEFKDRKIEFIAASSSTGYGNLSTATKTTSNSDCMQAFSYYSASALNADMSIYSASGWGVKFSAWTNPNSLNAFDAYRYVDFSYYMNGVEKLWDFSTYTPDVVVINYGTNDWSYIKMGVDANEKASRMQQFIDQYVNYLAFLHNIYPNAKIIMMYGLMNEKDIYQATEEIYNIALESNPELAIIKVQGDAKGSNSHPSVASHKEVAEDLVEKIKEVTGW